MTGTSRTGRAAWLWCVLVAAAVAAGPVSSPSEASQIYDLLKDTWNPTGIPPVEAVRTEIQLDTEVLQESHAGPNRPLRESDFTDLLFVQGGGG